MIVLKILYLAISIELIIIAFFIIQRLQKNIGDKRLSNKFNDNLVSEKKKLNRSIKNSVIALIITIFLMWIYSKYAILIIKFLDGIAISKLPK